MNLKNTVLAAAVAVAMPLAASAATVDSDGNITIDGIPEIGTTVSGDIYVPGSSQFNISFKAEDLGTTGILKFDVINTSGKTVNFKIRSTVNQGEADYGFMKGVDLWLSGVELSLGEGVGSFDVLTGTLEGGASTMFSFNYGEVYGTPGNFPDIDFRVTASVVPLPAAGLMLIGALGGLGMMQRRRKS